MFMWSPVKTIDLPLHSTLNEIQGIVCKDCKDICGWVIDEWLMKATEENIIAQTLEESRNNGMKESVF